MIFVKEAEDPRSETNVTPESPWLSRDCLASVASLKGGAIVIMRPLGSPWPRKGNTQQVDLMLTRAGSEPQVPRASGIQSRDRYLGGHSSQKEEHLVQSASQRHDSFF